MAQSAVIHQEFVYASHNAVVNTVCYNHLHDCFVSCDDANLRLWTPSVSSLSLCDLRVVSLPARTSHFIQAIAFLETRQLYIASALDGTLKILDLELNELTSIASGRSPILSLVFDSRHSKLFTGGVDGCGAWHVRGKPLVGPESVLNTLYELAAAPTFFQHTKPPAKVSASSLKSNHVVSSTTASKLSWVQTVQLNSEQTRLYAHTKRRVDVLSTADGQLLDSYTELFPAENGAITAFVVHEKTQYIVCGCANGCIFVLSVHPTSVVHVFKDHTMAVTGLAVHLSSHLIISSSLDGTVRLWDLEARRQAHRLDVRQPVHALALLTPSANPCRFYCRTRSTVQLFTIRSAAKEHLASLSPISILQRVALPTAATAPHHHPDAVMIPGEKLSPSRHISLSLLSTKEEAPTETEIEISEQAPRPWILAAGTDRTIRFYAGRTANEAPSFTWIPEEHALDVSGFSLHPTGHKLFILLDSQKIVIVDIRNQPIEKDNDDHNDDHDQADDDPPLRPHRIIDMDASPLSMLGSSSHAGSSQLPIKRAVSALAAAVTGESTTSPSSSQRPSGANTAANPALRGAVRSICCCYYPPIFRAAAGSSGSSGSSTAAAGDASTQLKWFSRTFVNRRQQSKHNLKKLDELASSAASPTNDDRTAPKALVQSDREWVICGTEYGHLVFWHSGLTNSFHEAISLDAHDASVVAIATSASSPLCVSLDASKRVHVWQFQPVFTLKHMVELNESPTCFVLAPTSELLLTGYEDGVVVLMNVSDAVDQVETYSGSDENHDAMVSGGDFLDSKLLLLTASVDAVVKIWDQQKNQLRQIQIAMALTCLCFMNDDGDVMAGVPSGILMLSKEDLLPDKLPTHAATEPSSPRRKKLPFWLSSEMMNSSPPKNDSQRQPESPTATAAAMAPAPPTGPRGKSLFQKKATVRFTDGPGDTVPIANSDDDDDDANDDEEASSATERVETEARNPLSSPQAVTWRRKNVQNESLALLMGASGTSEPSPLQMLRPPVLRPLDRVSSQQSNHRTTPTPASRPPSSRTLFPSKDPDWREVIMPSSPFHANANNFSARIRRERVPTASSAIIAELRALAHVPQPRGISPRTSAASTGLDHEQPPASGLGIGRTPTPLQYCKHQAPVPAKSKTPRKLWNAIGGEDRRLIAVQRNLPSI